MQCKDPPSESFLGVETHQPDDIDVLVRGRDDVDEGLRVVLDELRATQQKRVLALELARDAALFGQLGGLCGLAPWLASAAGCRGDQE